MTAEDDTYKGCFIPKGTMVLPIQSALLHNPATYPEPMQFSPERYLTRTSSGEWVLRDDVRDPRNFCFGFGRRACPGTHIAEQSLFASVATVLHTLDVRRSKNANGEEIVPEADVSGGVLSHPLPFDYEIHMRQDAKELVEMCSQ
jgi:cytochrome P450